MKRYLAAILCLFVVFTQFTGCAKTPDHQNGPSPSPALLEQTPSVGGQAEPAADPMTAFEEVRMALLSERGNFLGGLTAESMAEDFEYLFDVIRTSYPFLEVAERQGIDVEALYADYKENLSQIKNDLEFINYIAQIVSSFQGIGHFSFFMNAAEYDAYETTYASMQNSSERFQYLYDSLCLPSTQVAYQKLAEIEADVMALYVQYFGDDAAGAMTDDTQQARSSNIAIDYPSEGKIAHLKITSFAHELVESDKQTLLDFYSGLTGYEHLIIDITGNGGGDDMYWRQNIVAPLIDAPLKSTGYMLLSVSEYTEPYLQSGGFLTKARPISELPALENLDSEAASRMPLFIADETVVEPDGTEPFQGKVWLLVDEYVYSSSESFSMFAKDTGFATIIGTPTGGDGGGVDPQIFSLPNSGFLFRFSVFYTMNADGSSSEEFGTMPDIIIQDGQSPLDVCLNEINVAG